MYFFTADAPLSTLYWIWRRTCGEGKFSWRRRNINFMQECREHIGSMQNRLLVTWKSRTKRFRQELKKKQRISRKIRKCAASFSILDGISSFLTSRWRVDDSISIQYVLYTLTWSLCFICAMKTYPLRMFFFIFNTAQTEAHQLSAVKKIHREEKNWKRVENASGLKT